MKIATTTLCLLAALVATEAKTINLRLRVNVDHDRVSVTEMKDVDVSDIVDAVHNHATTVDDKSIVAHLSKGNFASSTRLHKAAATPEDDDDDKISSCESVEIQPWVKDLKYACTWGDNEYGYYFIYKLSNGTFFTNELCENEDKAGLDKVFLKSMNGAYLTSEEAKEYNFKCYSQEHATYVAKDHQEYESEFEYVATQFADLLVDADDDDDDDDDESDE